MSGEWLLVAPVLAGPLKRDSIYLPAGKWYDWYDGTAFEGPVWLNNFSAPLSKVPVFVRAGAIVPEYPLMQYDGQKPLDTLIVHAWPHGETAFELYEDDGYSKAYRQGAWQTMRISVSAPEDGYAEPVTVCAGQPQGGSFAGQLATRQYKAAVHFGYKPGKVRLQYGVQTEELPQASGLSALNAMEKGWFFDPAKGGITWLKTGGITSGQWNGDLFCMELTDFSEVSTDVETAEGDKLNIYPSPSDGNLTIETGTGAEIQRVDIRDTLGRQVRSIAASGEMATLSLGELPKGVYTIYVTTDSGIYGRKIVLE
jgi:hypothetical protein